MIVHLPVFVASCLLANVSLLLLLSTRLEFLEVLVTLQECTGGADFNSRKELLKEVIATSLIFT